MRHHAFGWLAIVGAAIAALVPREAQACSPPIPYLVSQRIVAPASGAIRVPLNATVTVAYAASLGMSTVALDHPAVRSAANAMVVTPLTSSTNPTLFTLTSPVLLVPNMRYEVLSEIPNVPCFGADAPGRTPPCWPAAVTSAVDGGPLDAGEVDGGAATVAPPAVPLREISYFTTGDTTDETPPTSPGPLTISKTASSCHSGGCCFDYDGFEVRIGWAPAQDDTGIAYYEITAPDGQILPLQTPTSTQSIVMCSAAATFGGIDTPGKYQLVAVDLAGHRSPPVTIDLSDTCDRGCGCRIGGAGRSGTLGAGMILSILLLAARRSRRRQSRQSPEGSGPPS